MTWDDATIERLRALHAEGLSSRQIAELLGGVTRNSVIGKLYRLGLCRPREESEPRQTKPKPRLSKSTASARKLRIKRLEEGKMTIPAIVPVVTPPTDTAIPLLLSVLELKPSSCRFPIGIPGAAGFGFCGHQKAPGSSYCARHHRIVWQPLQRQAQGRAR